jgi:hypothetical protein
MLNISQREEQGNFGDYHQIKSLSCSDMQRIDRLWFNADNRFGFSVQKDIWISIGNRLDINSEYEIDKDRENYDRFFEVVGWFYNNKLGDGSTRENELVSSHAELLWRIESNAHEIRGSLPMYPYGLTTRYFWGPVWFRFFFSRVATCKT